MAIYCTSCGASQDADGTFCDACGASLAQQATCASAMRAARRPRAVAVSVGCILVLGIVGGIWWMLQTDRVSASVNAVSGGLAELGSFGAVRVPPRVLPTGTIRVSGKWPTGDAHRQGPVLEIHADSRVLDKPIELALGLGTLPKGKRAADVQPLIKRAGRWLALPGQIDEAHGTIRFQTTHLTEFSWGLRVGSGGARKLIEPYQQLVQALTRHQWDPVEALARDRQGHDQLANAALRARQLESATVELADQAAPDAVIHVGGKAYQVLPARPRRQPGPQARTSNERLWAVKDGAGRVVRDRLIAFKVLYARKALRYLALAKGQGLGDTLRRNAEHLRKMATAHAAAHLLDWGQKILADFLAYSVTGQAPSASSYVQKLGVKLPALFAYLEMHRLAFDLDAAAVELAEIETGTARYRELVFALSVVAKAATQLGALRQFGEATLPAQGEGWMMHTAKTVWTSLGSALLGASQRYVVKSRKGSTVIKAKIVAAASLAEFGEEVRKLAVLLGELSEQSSATLAYVQTLVEADSSPLSGPLVWGDAFLATRVRKPRLVKKPRPSVVRQPRPHPIVLPRRPVSLSPKLHETFDTNAARRWRFKEGDVRVVGGRLRVVRTARHWGVAERALPRVLTGSWQLDVTMECLTPQSLLSLCLLERMQGGKYYCLSLNTKTENGSRPGAHLFYSAVHGNPGVPASRRVLSRQFNPGAGRAHRLRLTHTSDGLFELFVDGTSVARRRDTRLNAFRGIRLFGFQDTSSGHGGYFDDLVLRQAGSLPAAGGEGFRWTGGWDIRIIDETEAPNHDGEKNGRLYLFEDGSYVNATSNAKGAALRRLRRVSGGIAIHDKNMMPFRRDCRRIKRLPGMQACSFGCKGGTPASDKCVFYVADNSTVLVWDSDVGPFRRTLTRWKRAVVAPDKSAFRKCASSGHH